MPIDEVTKEVFCYDSNNERSTPEKCGWHKKIVWRAVVGEQEIYEPVKNRPTQIIKKRGIVYRVYEVTAKPCKICSEAQDGLNCDFVHVQSVKTMPFKRCFRSVYGAFGDSDITIQLADLDDVKHFKLLEEKIITESEVFELYSKGLVDYIADMGLIHKIEKSLGRTL